MVQAIVQDMNGGKVADLELDDRIFGLRPNVPLMHQAVVAIEGAGAPRGAWVLRRADIARTHGKWFRQKGTGRARHGSRAAAQFVGGNKAFGPRGGSRAKQLPKKMRRLAVCSALSAKQAAGALRIVDQVAVDGYSTRRIVRMLADLEADGRVLLVLPLPPETDTGDLAPEAADDLERVLISARNVVALETRLGAHFSVRDVLAADCIILARDVVDSLHREWLS
jgi:large subunit ribosomal protein L4